MEGVVENVYFEPHENKGIGYAYITLEVEDVLKGTANGTIVLRRASINEEGNYYYSQYSPTYSRGDQIIACLIKDDEGYYRALGLYNGIFYVSGEYIKTTNIKVIQLKNWIEEILKGEREELPLEFPDFMT